MFPIAFSVVWTLSSLTAPPVSRLSVADRSAGQSLFLSLTAPPVSRSFFVNQVMDTMDYFVVNALDRRSGPRQFNTTDAERRATLD
ncbi:MAG: hypothetical protein KDA51_15435 [Planctomycetales bacterium]|nr:hypothetical protein [Planctomycetales bacterium]